MYSEKKKRINRKSKKKNEETNKRKEIFCSFWRKTRNGEKFKICGEVQKKKCQYQMTTNIRKKGAQARALAHGEI